MRRVAGALEAVELDGGQRIGWRDLVDDQHEAAEPRHPRKLGDGAFRTGHVVEGAERGGDVERAAVEVEVGDISFDEPHIGKIGRATPALLQELGHDVDRDHLAHERRKRERERARSRAGIEHALVALRIEEGPEALAQRLAAALLALGHERRGAAVPTAYRLSVLGV